jgi:hypothetical protein
MLKRLVRGLVAGSAPGVGIAVLLSRLGISWTAVAAYAAAAVVGAVAGLVAGTPVWHKGAKVEGALKAVVSAFIAAVVMFGIRKWLPVPVLDLGNVSGGRGPIGELPLIALPLIGTALAWVLEVDDAFGPDPAPAVRRRVIDETVAHDDEETAEEDSAERRSKQEN